MLLLCLHAMRETKKDLQLLADQWSSAAKPLGWKLHDGFLTLGDLGCDSVLPLLDFDDLSVAPAFKRQRRGKRKWLGLISDVPDTLTRYEWCVFIAMEIGDSESQGSCDNFCWIRRSMGLAEWTSWGDVRGHKWKHAGSDWYVVSSQKSAGSSQLIDQLRGDDDLAFVAEVFVDRDWIWCCGLPWEYSEETRAAVERLAQRVAGVAAKRSPR